jgi:hypothetical protein
MPPLQVHSKERLMLLECTLLFTTGLSMTAELGRVEMLRNFANVGFREAAP